MRGGACLALLAAALLAWPAPAQEAVAHFGSAHDPHPLVLRTTTDVAVLSPAIRAFLRDRPALGLTYEQWGSNALYDVTQADCAAGQAGADMVISSGVHQMIRLVNDRCASAWRSPATATLPADLRWRDEIWGISREPAVIVYNRRLVPPEAVPRSRFALLDLLRPEGTAYAGAVATYDIEESGLGYLFAFMDSQQASTFGALMETFARTGAVATCCSAEIIDGVGTGTYRIAYNVLGSYAALAARQNPDLGLVLPSDYTLVLARAALLPGPAAPRPEAGALLDFLLSGPGQTALAQTNLVMGLSPDQIDPGDGDLSVPIRLIPLSPTLLVAMDPAYETRFIARWRAAFGP